MRRFSSFSLAAVRHKGFVHAAVHGLLLSHGEKRVHNNNIGITHGIAAHAFASEIFLFTSAGLDQVACCLFDVLVRHGNLFHVLMSSPSSSSKNVERYSPVQTNTKYRNATGKYKCCNRGFFPPTTVIALALFYSCSPIFK